MLTAIAVEGRELPTLSVWALYTAMLVIGCAVLGAAFRDREIALKRRLHLQSWQLRQLVAQ